MNQKRSFTHGIALLVIAAITFGIAAALIMSVNEVQALPIDSRQYQLSAAESTTQETAVDWESWFIHSETSQWSVSEMEMVRETLANTSSALDEAGFDSWSLLAGYRFRRYHGQFVDGVDGRIALVRHTSKEVLLADTAFARLWGYYIYHELGHVVDKRLGRELSLQFHTLAANDAGSGSQMTPDGYWLNEHARTDREEAAADAFALWVVLRHTENPRPVFWNTPNTINYETIVQTVEETLRQIA
jgi:hypothetical protein